MEESLEEEKEKLRRWVEKGMKRNLEVSYKKKKKSVEVMD